MVLKTYGYCSSSQNSEFRSQNEDIFGGLAEGPPIRACCLPFILVEVSKLLEAYSRAILTPDS